MDWPEHSGQVHLISLIHCSWRASMPKKPSLPWVNLLPQSNDEDDATSRVASEQFQNCSSLAYVVLTKMHCVLRWVSSTCSPQSTAPNCELLPNHICSLETWQNFSTCRRWTFMMLNVIKYVSTCIHWLFQINLAPCEWKEPPKFSKRSNIKRLQVFCWFVGGNYFSIQHLLEKLLFKVEKVLRIYVSF